MVAALGVASLAAGFMVVGTASTAQAGPKTEPAENHVPVTVCHAAPPETAAQGWQLITPDADSVLQAGHGDHAADIYEAFKYWEWDKETEEWDEIAVPGMNLTRSFGGASGQEILDNGCAIPESPKPVVPVAPYATPPDCEEPGMLVIPTQPTGVTVNQVPAGTGPGTYVITFSTADGYEFPDGTTTRYDVVVLPGIPYQSTSPGAACYVSPEGHRALAVPPTVVQSTRCEVEGSYTIPATVGVQYLLDGKAIAAGTYPGPKTGSITAEAQHSYQLVNEDFSFALNVAPAATCPPPYTPPPVTVDVCSNIDGDQAVVPDGYTRDAQTNICTEVPVPPQATAVEPEVVQSEACDVEGSYTIPATAGVQYLLDGVEVEAGTYDGPVDGVLTAAGVDDTVLTNPDFEYMLVVEPAEDCPAEVLPTEAVDVCPNLPGDQEAVPNGYEMDKGKCVEIEKTEPKPPAEEPDEVLGTEAAVPTEVDAGLVGPSNTTGGPSSPIGQALMGAGLMLLVLAGTMQAGRRERGVHEA